MRRLLTPLRTLALLGACALLAQATASPTDAGTPPQVVVYVESQGLYYDSIVTADPLPARGQFQLLEMGPNGLTTELGPGDRGYLGGRWKEDFDGDNEFHYFLCPLIGEGRENP